MKREPTAQDLETARNIWEELRSALELCGDAGPFRPEDFVWRDLPRVTWEGRPVLPPAVLSTLEEKGPAAGNEVVWTAYEAIALVAAGRLGLEGNLALGFADALACLRTGVVGGHGTLAEQCMAQDIFLATRSWGEEWNPDDTGLKRALAAVYERFAAWQKDPALYARQVEEFWRARR